MMIRVLKNTWLWFGVTILVAAAAYFWLVASQPALPSQEGQQDLRSGSIETLSSPTGAQLSLDGKALDQSSPATIDGVTPGKHTIKFTLSGYQEQELSVVVEPGHPVWAQIEMVSQ